jgi:phenylacetate-CoA ligase
LGELVFTTLAKEALPLLRYRTRDLTRLQPGTLTSMRRLQRISGRSDDMLIIRGVNVFPSQIEALILQEQRLAPHYVLELRRAGRLDDLTVLVEPRQGANDSSIHIELSAGLTRRIKELVGVSCTVQIVEIGRIERSIGKARRVIDLRGK